MFRNPFRNSKKDKNIKADQKEKKSQNPGKDSDFENNQKIEKEMGLTIKKAELVDINSDIIEYGIDEVMSDGILKEIPIVSLLNSGYKIQKTIRTGLFIKRIIKFLFELSDTTPEEREQYVNRINSEDKFVNQVGEQLIMIIEKIDDYEKAHIIGRLFRASIKGIYSYDEFMYLAHMVNSTYSKHLLKLKQTEKDGKYFIHKLSEIERESLIRSGLMFQPDMKKKIRHEINKSKRFKIDKSPAKMVVDAFEFNISKEAFKILKYGFE